MGVVILRKYSMHILQNQFIEKMYCLLVLKNTKEERIIQKRVRIVEDKEDLAVEGQ